MNKKLLVSVFLCFFVFSLGVVSREYGVRSQGKEWKATIQAEAEEPESIIYVDDATGDDKKGNGSEKKPFKTIKKALSAADSGYTIKVGQGVYNESLIIRTIDKIAIEGSGSDVTTINGGSDTSTIIAAYNKYLRIKGLTILGGYWNGLSCHSVHNATIRDCVFRGSRHGIHVRSHSSVEIINCQMMNNTKFGLWVSTSARASLERCTISENGSIGIWATTNALVQLDLCEISNHHMGMALDWNSHLYMSGCLIHNNVLGLLVGHSGVANLFFVYDRNEIYDNTDAGIQIHHGGNVCIANADIRNNNEGILVDGASILFLESDVTIRDHLGTGVDVSSFAHAFLGGANITGNNIGVHIHAGGQASCNPDTITGNTTNIISDCEHCPPIL